MFKYKTLEEISKMSAEEQQTYSDDCKKHEQGVIDTLNKEIEALKTKGITDGEVVTALKSKVDEMNANLEKVSIETKALKEQKQDNHTLKGIKAILTEKAEALKSLKNLDRGAKVAFEVADKAFMDADTDIDTGSDFATMLEGVAHQPVRRPIIRELFRRRPFGTEFLKYTEQDTVTRDAKFVVACAQSSHDTKVSFKVRSVQMAKVRDFVDVCIDMLEDYDFVEGEIYLLINESLNLKVDAELLLGVSANPEDLISIDSVASEFNPANPLADFTNAFQDANLEQLVDAMATQIAVFGQLNHFKADTVVVSPVTLTKYRNLKDSEGNKIIQTITIPLPSGQLYVYNAIAGIRTIESPLIGDNELYIFDSSRGTIFERKRKTVDISFENNDNFEREVATIKGYERLQFLVKNVDRDAFMKCSDVATAIAAITQS